MCLQQYFPVNAEMHFTLLQCATLEGVLQGGSTGGLARDVLQIVQNICTSDAEQRHPEDAQTHKALHSASQHQLHTSPMQAQQLAYAVLGTV